MTTVEEWLTSLSDPCVRGNMRAMLEKTFPCQEWGEKPVAELHEMFANELDDWALNRPCDMTLQQCYDDLRAAGVSPEVEAALDASLDAHARAPFTVQDAHAALEAIPEIHAQAHKAFLVMAKQHAALDMDACAYLRSIGEDTRAWWDARPSTKMCEASLRWIHTCVTRALQLPEVRLRLTGDEIAKIRQANKEAWTRVRMGLKDDKEAQFEVPAVPAVAEPPPVPLAPAPVVAEVEAPAPAVVVAEPPPVPLAPEVVATYTAILDFGTVFGSSYRAKRDMSDVETFYNVFFPHLQSLYNMACSVHKQRP